MSRVGSGTIIESQMLGQRLSLQHRLECENVHLWHQLQARGSHHKPRTSGRTCTVWQATRRRLLHQQEVPPSRQTPCESLLVCVEVFASLPMAGCVFRVFLCWVSCWPFQLKCLLSLILDHGKVINYQDQNCQFNSHWMSLIHSYL